MTKTWTHSMQNIRSKLTTTLSQSRLAQRLLPRLSPLARASPSSKLRSGSILVSDSLERIALSMSYDMLFNVQLNIPADTSFVLPASNTQTLGDDDQIERPVEPNSPSHISAIVTADLLFNVVLDLPPATPSTPPADRRSCCRGVSPAQSVQLLISAALT